MSKIRFKIFSGSCSRYWNEILNMFFSIFLVEIWFKNNISIKNMSYLTLNPTSINNHNAQYAHKYAISTQRGVTTQETQREKNNGEMMQISQIHPWGNQIFAKHIFGHGGFSQNMGKKIF